MSDFARTVEAMDLFDDGYDAQPIRCESIEDRIKKATKSKARQEEELKVLTYLVGKHNDNVTLAQALSRTYMGIVHLDRNITGLLKQQEAEG